MSTNGQSIGYPYMTEVTVENYLDRKRIDLFLVRHFRNYTRPRMQRLIRGKQVWIEGVQAKPRFRVRSGQRVRVRLIEPPDKLIEAEPLPLDILYEDDSLIAVNKPAGQTAHPGGNYHRGTLANALQFHLDGQTPLPGLLRPGIVHRLDRLTSGVIVACKDHYAHRELSMAFQRGQVRKSYLALVHGWIAEDAGCIDTPIGQLPDVARMGTGPLIIKPKSCRTEFAVVQRYAQPYSLVRAKPLTGRLHQIRVHLASIGHPIVADEFYATDLPIDISNLGLNRQALHAADIKFPHPRSGISLSLTAPLAADIERVLYGLSLQTD